jgi:hypothetical protein
MDFGHFFEDFCPVKNEKNPKKSKRRPKWLKMATNDRGIMADFWSISGILGAYLWDFRGFYGFGGILGDFGQFF